MLKEIDASITTISDFRNATKSLDGDIQIFIHKIESGELTALGAITEIQLNLPKTSEEEPFLILRAV